MVSLHKLISIEEEIYRSRPFSKNIMDTTFIERINTNYPLVYIDESMFKIEIVYYTTEFIIEKQRVCKIILSDSLIVELAEHYPESLI